MTPSSLSTPPVRYLYTLIRKIPPEPSLPQSEQPQHSASPCITDALIPQSSLWPFEGLTPVCLCQAQNWIQESRCGLTSAEQRGRITSVDLLVTVILTQSRCCWTSLLPRYIASSCSLWCPPGPQVPFLQSCFPESHPSACTGAWGCSSPGEGICIILLLNFMKFLLAHFSSLSRSL